MSARAHWPHARSWIVSFAAWFLGCQGLPSAHAPETRALAMDLARPVVTAQLEPWMPEARGEFRLRFGDYRRRGTQALLYVAARNHWGATIPFVCDFRDDGNRLELLRCR